MISKPDIKKLITMRVKDAEVLFKSRRYDSAIYLVGFAIELALKLEICKMYNFTNGFPENKIEFERYRKHAQSESLLQQTISDVRQIRNHDLSKLLKYSGYELKIKQYFLAEWTTIFGWNPEMRYKISLVRKVTAKRNLDATVKIIDALK